jgi:hypothetical protein
MACAVLELWSLHLSDDALAAMGFKGVVPIRKFKQLDFTFTGGDFR